VADEEGSSVSSRADGGAVVGVGEGGGVGYAEVVRLSEAVAVGVGLIVVLGPPGGVLPPVVVAGADDSGSVGVTLGSGKSEVGPPSCEGVGLVAGCGR
jgi:hypothetical protein